MPAGEIYVNPFSWLTGDEDSIGAQRRVLDWDDNRPETRVDGRRSSRNLIVPIKGSGPSWTVTVVDGSVGKTRSLVRIKPAVGRTYDGWYLDFDNGPIPGHVEQADVLLLTHVAGDAYPAGVDWVLEKSNNGNLIIATSGTFEKWTLGYTKDGKAVLNHPAYAKPVRWNTPE